MSHHTARQGYAQFVDRINRFPQGAPPSETLYKILEMLFTEQEARLMAQLPIKPFGIPAAAKIWGVSHSEAEKILNRLAERAMLLDTEVNGEMTYVLPPPMAGFLEFTLMRTRGDIDQKLLSELFHQYMNVEEDFIKALFWSAETKMGRVYVQERVLSTEQAIDILDYERASHIIKSAGAIGVSMCYCRHKAEHRGEACDAPVDVCLTFGTTAQSLAGHGYARLIESAEGLDILARSYENNLVQCGENVQNEPAFICNCCGCCCEALVAAKKFGGLVPVNTTNYLPQVLEGCVGCGRCASVCPVEAVAMEPRENARPLAVVNEEICLGCGVCVSNCSPKQMLLKARGKRVITPVNSVHRFVLMAIEKGQLQNLIFDNQALGSHRAMGAILGAILRMPPVKQLMASQQMKSVYLAKMLSKMKP